MSQLRSRRTASANSRLTLQARGRSGSRAVPVGPARHRHQDNSAPQHGEGPRLLQAKLTISDPNDIYEKEADRVADQVLRMPDSARPQPGIDSAPIRPVSIQRLCPECEEELHRRPARTQPENTPPGIDGVESVLRQPGRPLDRTTRAFFEPRFGVDFGAVRIHTDAQAATSARAVNALAYSVGRSIVLNSGQYAPHTDSGKRLLAHELTYVVQQDDT